MLIAIGAGTAEVGWIFVQAGAYGDETRFLLRPPGPLVAGPMEVAWMVMALAVGSGPLLLAARLLGVIGLVVTAAAVALVIVLAPRFHPVGAAVVRVRAGGRRRFRDPLVLADTAMFRRPDVEGLSLALAGTAATDLTARALGPAVEVELAGAGTITLAGAFVDATDGGNVAIESFMVSPGRPGRLLAEAARAHPVA